MTGGRATSTISAGDIVSACPWVNGSETRDVRAGFVTATASANFGDEYVLVWFYGMGGMNDDEVGRAWQPVLRSKLTVIGSLSGGEAGCLRRLLAATRGLEGDPEAEPFRQALIAALAGRGIPA
jgi:hypothetical protein